MALYRCIGYISCRNQPPAMTEFDHDGSPPGSPGAPGQLPPKCTVFIRDKMCWDAAENELFAVTLALSTMGPAAGIVDHLETETGCECGPFHRRSCSPSAPCGVSTAAVTWRPPPGLPLPHPPVLAGSQSSHAPHAHHFPFPCGPVHLAKLTPVLGPDTDRPRL